MKILLFNLGTIEHRIISWEVDGFKSIFEQDVILWGPIPDKHFSYNGKEIAILGVFEPTTIKGVFEKLPAGWYPDIVVCDTSVLNYVPDIYLCPVKTILFTRDSWSDAVFNRGLVECFDFLNSSTIDREIYREHNVCLLPLSGFAVSVPGTDSPNSEFEKRDIDVIAIANYDNSFYHERYKTFYNLSALNKTGLKIKYLRRIQRTEIYNYYQRSKIVLDWSHTLSNRSYEAALNGCLLFSHEDNQVLSDFWKPWDEYVPYNESNLSELVNYYLNNPALSKRIINNTQRKIKTLPIRWGEMAWEKISLAYKTDRRTEDRIKLNESVPASKLHHRSATALLYNYDYGTNFPSNWKELYYKRINAAIAGAKKTDDKIPPLIEAARLAFLLKESQLSLSYLNELQQILPDYGWVYYFTGRIYYEKGENESALQMLQQAISCGLKAPDLLQRYVLPVIEKGNACDGRRVTSYMWQSVCNHKQEFQVKSFMHLSNELAGIIYQKISDEQNALNSFTEAIDYIPVPDCIYRVSPTLISAGFFDKLLEITSKGLEDSPYDSIIVLYCAYAYLQQKKRKEASRVLHEHQNALKSFVGIRLFKYIRITIFALLPLTSFGKMPASWLILKAINVLKVKAGIVYLD